MIFHEVGKSDCFYSGSVQRQIDQMIDAMNVHFNFHASRYLCFQFFEHIRWYPTPRITHYTHYLTLFACIDSALCAKISGVTPHS